MVGELEVTTDYFTCTGILPVPQMNFLLEFDIGFYGAQMAFELSPKQLLAI